MNNKLQSSLSILAITCAVAVPLLLPTAHELPVQAALTPPASYNLNYRWDVVNDSSFALGGSSLGDEYPIYTRTADGIYYNYSTTIDNSDFNLIPLGLEITMTFNRSNTNWFFASGGYYPQQNNIGSTNAVGGVKKMFLQFSNDTNKDYQLYFDHSTTNQGTIAFGYSINSIWLGRLQTNDGQLLVGTMMGSLYIPAFSNVVLERTTNVAFYFDAWYLKDLGVSAAYDAGYEVGEDDGYADGLANNPNLLINAAESLIGMFVNFTFILFTLEMFGVSILTIVGVLFGIVAITWILKTIRG